MLKKTTYMLLVICISLVLFAGTGSAASMLKVAVVDLQSALNATSEGLAAKEILSKKNKEKREQLTKMQAELSNMEEKIKSPVISQEALEKLKEQYLKARSNYVDFASKAKAEMDREEKDYTNRIVEGLIKIVNEIAVAENYSLVLQKGINNIIYSDESMDITDRVVKIYNEKYQAGDGK